MSAPRRVGTFPGVGTFFQVLAHASTSQFANKKVHMISMTDVGTCQHVSAPRRVGTCRYLPRCRHLFRCWHMPAHLSLQIKKSIWLVWRMSARVGTCRCRHICRHVPARVGNLGLWVLLNESNTHHCIVGPGFSHRYRVHVATRHWHQIDFFRNHSRIKF